MGEHVRRTRDWVAEDPGTAGILDRFARSGLNNWWLPTNVGGAGLALEEGVDVAEELAAHDAGLAFAACVSGLAGTIIDGFADPAVRDRVLRGIAVSGGYLATAGSEHEAGSELQHLATTAAEADDGFVVQGVKAFATNADRADHVVVICRRVESRRAFVALVVPRASEGLRSTREWETTGLRTAETVELAFDEVRVSSEAVCRGNGLRLLETGLNVSRTYLAAIAIGICRRLMTELCSYAQDKVVAGVPLLKHPVFGARLAELYVTITSMRSVVRDAARAYDHAVSGAPTEPIGVLPEVVTAKLLCGRLAWEQAAALSSVMGGLGYIDGSPVDRALRDARHVSIIEGGEDVLRELLHRRVILPAARKSASRSVMTHV